MYVAKFYTIFHLTWPECARGARTSGQGVLAGARSFLVARCRRGGRPALLAADKNGSCPSPLVADEKFSRRSLAHGGQEVWPPRAAKLLFRREQSPAKLLVRRKRGLVDFLLRLPLARSRRTRKSAAPRRSRRTRSLAKLFVRQEHLPAPLSDHWCVCFQ